MSDPLSYEELEKELSDLKFDYHEALDKAYEARKALMQQALQPKSNEFLRMATKRADSAETYLEAYEEYYGKLPKGLHMALLMLTGASNLDATMRKERARDLAKASKKSARFISWVKGKKV